MNIKSMLTKLVYEENYILIYNIITNECYKNKIIQGQVVQIRSYNSNIFELFGVLLFLT